ESPALKGSKRSQEFLQFVVEKALDGHYDDLKERTLGVELFGRRPSYDTGTDAIVRVTACDLRRRLLQFYAAGSDHSGYRIELPPGSYVPEFQSAKEALPDSAPAAEIAAARADPVKEPADPLPAPIAPESSKAMPRAFWTPLVYGLCGAALASIL